MTRTLSFTLLVLVALAAFAAHRLLEASLAADVYRERLMELSADYEQLRGRYDEAVRRTAVTELVVADGKLSVVIRTAEGELKSFESPFDPSREIYVDYVVRDGRLWIRRLFDDRTPPGEGMSIDPRLIDVDWETVGEGYGKAAYRALGEGRWVVEVTGDGSLGLARRDPEEVVELAPPPPVREYEPVAETVESVLGSIRASEAFRALARQIERGV
ncbi:MAG: hypothetical protein JRG80_02505 [Deltaproteobacteria bacterium]|nr:hypothetical protein [Deltaproteobacteria bacterium]MBW2398124.1 hypothetical protein [Deltaproteobacteria bacterium]